MGIPSEAWSLAGWARHIFPRKAKPQRWEYISATSLQQRGCKPLSIIVIAQNSHGQTKHIVHMHHSLVSRREQHRHCQYGQNDKREPKQLRGVVQAVNVIRTTTQAWGHVNPCNLLEKMEAASSRKSFKIMPRPHHEWLDRNRQSESEWKTQKLQVRGKWT